MLVVLAFLAGLELVSARLSLPVNCSYPQIVGSWRFMIGQGGHDNTIDCQNFGTHQNPEVMTLGVTLYFPDFVMDEHDNEGRWVLVANSGFEVEVGGRKYFAFSKWRRTPRVQNICNATMIGWSHDVDGRNWACYVGHKVRDGGDINTGPSTPQKTKPRQWQQTQSSQEKHRGYTLDSSHLVDQINSQQTSWKARTYSEFEDVPLEDMVKMFGGRQTSMPSPSAITAEQMMEADNLPESFDWRDVNGINYVPPIRRQGFCGSCYAFASLSMLESRWRIASNNTLQPIFSVQDVVECSNYSQGCHGGFTYLTGGKYAEDFGLVLEECNQYIKKDRNCSTSRNCPRYYATDYQFIGGFYGACNEALMRIHLVRHGPIAASMAAGSNFGLYEAGIFHDLHLLGGKFDPYTRVTHAVSIVGYGTDRSQGEAIDYWIIRNSFGTHWGEDGYMRMVRGNNECYIESMAVQAFPVL